jgi:two-component system, OmpR family, sensor kinase
MLSRLQYTWSPGIRIQLTLLYTAIFALLIVLFSLMLYMTLQTLLTSSLDSALQLRAQQIAGGISSDGGKIIIQDVTGELPGIDATATSVEAGGSNAVVASNSSGSHNVASDVNIGVLVRILNQKGQVAYISPAFRALTPPAASVTQPLRGSPWQDTITAYHGQTVRLYSFALTDNGTVFGVLQVGESLAQLTTTLQTMTIALLAIVPVVLLSGAFASYALARQAFKPILYLTRTAQEIKAGDLHRRVPVPRAKDEVHDLALTLNEMIGRLDQAFTQQRRFVADASHELRTPVAVLRSMTDVAQEEEPLSLEEYADVLGGVNAETERLTRLINDLLTLARVDEERIPLDREPLRLDLLSFDVAASMEHLAIERGIELQVQAKQPAIVSGDTARLIQVMMSLVDNALTYTNRDGKVTLNVAVSGACATFSVCDTGIGIAQEEIKLIFERFYRADPARSRAAGGSGLGLSLADWIVRAHGGTITVVSQVGQGSTFTVSLPLALSTVA